MTGDVVATQFLVRCRSSEIAEAAKAIFSDLPGGLPDEDAVEIDARQTTSRVLT